MDTKIKIGDIVKIVDDGETYVSYEIAAKAMGLTNWISGHLRSLKNRYVNLYEVVGVFERPTPHNSKFFKIIGITNGEEDFVIGINGVEVISSAPPVIPEKAKGPQLFDINNLYSYTDIAE